MTPTCLRALSVVLAVATTCLTPAALWAQDAGGGRPGTNGDDGRRPAAPTRERAARAAEPVAGAAALAGWWEGAATVDGVPLLIGLAIEATPRGPAGAVTIDAWDLHDDPVELDWQPPRLAFGARGLRLALALALEGDALAGTARLAREDVDAVVHLTRGARPARPPVVATPVRFPSADGVVLAGTLVRPATPGPHPAAVLLSGRGYGVRDRYVHAAVRLARRGVAALAFDGRGQGGSGGDGERVTARQRIDDAVAAVDRLVAHADVDAGQVGLFGHSVGGWVAPYVAARDERIAFLLVKAAPVEAVAPQRATFVRMNMILSGEPYTADEFDAATRYTRTVIEQIVRGDGWDELAPMIAHAAQQRWARHADLPESLEDPELIFFHDQPYDPQEVWEKVDVPVLALWGERDPVAPAAVSMPLLRRAAEAAGNDDVTMVALPGADHAFWVDGGWEPVAGVDGGRPNREAGGARPRTGAASREDRRPAGEGERGEVDGVGRWRWGRVAPGYWAAVDGWLRAHVRTAVPRDDRGDPLEGSGPRGPRRGR